MLILMMITYFSLLQLNQKHVRYHMVSHHSRLQSDDTVEVRLKSAAEFQSQILPEVPG